MTYMLLLNCALKLVEEIILYYDARSKKHQITLSTGLSSHRPAFMSLGYLSSHAVCSFEDQQMSCRILLLFVIRG